MIRTVCVLFVLLLALFAFCSCGVNNTDTVTDGADILTAADEEKINSSASKYSDIRFFTVTYNSRRDGFFDGRKFLYEKGLSTEDNTVIIVVDASGMHLEWSVCVYGRIEDRLLGSKLSSMVTSAQSGTDVAGGAARLMSRISEAAAFPWLGLILGSIGIGVLVGGVVCGIVAARYKMKIRPTNYPLEHYTSSELTDRHDIFINSRVSVVRVSNDDNKR